MITLENNCEICIPVCYYDGQDIIYFSENVLDEHLCNLSNIISNKLTGFSIRDEIGFYKNRKMKNKVIYFYYTDDMDFEINNMLKYILKEMEQETVFVTKNGVGYIYDSSDVVKGQ